jgi:hypothetical protein
MLFAIVVMLAILILCAIIKFIEWLVAHAPASNRMRPSYKNTKIWKELNKFLDIA